VGDHLGFNDATLEALRDATVIGVGPVSVHADDAIVIVANELDRRVEQRTAAHAPTPSTTSFTSG
jgi:tRNA pseudouridine-54 N-methylase